MKYCRVQFCTNTVLTLQPEDCCYFVLFLFLFLVFWSDNLEEKTCYMIVL